MCPSRRSSYHLNFMRFPIAPSAGIVSITLEFSCSHDDGNCSPQAASAAEPRNSRCRIVLVHRFSSLLGQISIKVTERDYSRWVRARSVPAPKACAASNTKQFRRTSTHTRSAELTTEGSRGARPWTSTFFEVFWPDVSQFYHNQSNGRPQVYDSKDGEMLERSIRHAWKATRASGTKSL
jgi:hypothetical protein